MSEHQCKIVRVVDGDTVDVDIDLGFGVWLHNERIRIEGIDSPESRTRNLIEKFFGIAAKNRVKELLPKGSIQTLVCGDSGEGKFGRILGDFKFGDTRLTIFRRIQSRCDGAAFTEPYNLTYQRTS